MVLEYGSAPTPEATVVDLSPTPLAVLSYPATTIEHLTEIFDDGFGVLGAAIDDGVFTPAGHPVAVYHGDPMATFDLQIGFPVEKALDAGASHSGMSIEPAVLPSGPAWIRTHVGSYDSLGSGWADLLDLVTAAGAQPRGVWVEVYVSPPSDPEDSLRTDLVLPVAD